MLLSASRVAEVKRLKNSQGIGYFCNLCVFISVLQKCHNFAVCLVWLCVVFPDFCYRKEFDGFEGFELFRTCTYYDSSRSHCFPISFTFCFLIFRLHAHFYLMDWQKQLLQRLITSCTFFSDAKLK